MQLTSDHGLTFLATSASPPKGGFFQGYFFHDNDYIYGKDGLSQFSSETGHELNEAYDGCYVYVRHHDGLYEFNTDFSGYKVLYYFHDGSTWAVSDSFARLVDFLRHTFGSIEPNYAHLGSISSTNSTNNQLFSFETLVRGVKVLPRSTTLYVARDRMHLVSRALRRAENYSLGLMEHLERWVSRFETLMTDPRFQLSIDLTGGLDSRTNFALAVMAEQRLADNANSPRFTCAGTLETSEDFRVANDLCQAFGYSLNPPNRVNREYYTPQEAYEVFRNSSLGVYYPLVIPTLAPSPFRVHAGGGGGEVHRDFYNPDHVDRFFNNHGKRNAFSWLGLEAAQDGRQAIASLQKSFSDHPLRAHYREFRHRYHVGRLPRISASFTPLDSITAEAAQLVAGNKRIDIGQWNYDILASLRPELLDIDFDSPSKAPTSEIRDQITTVEIRSMPSPGRVWTGDTPQGDSTTQTSPSQRGKVLHERVLKAVENQFVRSFCGDEMTGKAVDLAADLSIGKSIGNAVNGFPISAVLSAHLVAPTQ